MPLEIFSEENASAELQVLHKEILHALQHSLKLDEPTTLALKMIEEGRQRSKLPAPTPAIPVGTVIYRRLMHRTRDVHVEAVGCLALLVADVAFVATSVPC